MESELIKLQEPYEPSELIDMIDPNPVLKARRWPSDGFRPPDLDIFSSSQDIWVVQGEIITNKNHTSVWKDIEIQVDQDDFQEEEFEYVFFRMNEDYWIIERIDK